MGFEARPYVLPFWLWLVGLAPQVFNPSITVWAYPFRTVIVAGILLYFRKRYSELKPRLNLGAVLLGVLVFVFWVALEPFLPKWNRSQISWTPDVLRSESQTGYWIWIFFRVVGSAIVVAYAEELFWRGFLLRWMISPHYRQVPLGTFSLGSFLTVALLFGMEHDAWLLGVFVGVCYSGLLYWSKNLFDCVLAHGITNFLLAIYVLKTGAWRFW